MPARRLSYGTVRDGPEQHEYDVDQEEVQDLSSASALIFLHGCELN